MTSDLVRQKFAERIISELARRNWNQSDLAKEATKHLPKGALTRDSVSNYCNAKSLPGPGFLRAIALAFGTSPEDILPERGVHVARETGPIMPVDVRDVGGGFAFVRVNKRVRFDTALKILTAINDDIRQDLDDERIPDNG